MLFEKEGFHGVTVKQIVEAVGISKGGFYHHFTSKDELLFVIHDIFITYALDKASLANEQHDSPTDRLRAIIKDFVSVFDMYQAHLTVFYQENIYLLPEHALIVKEKRNQFKDMIKAALQDGIVSGEFRKELSVDITALAILGMVNWTYRWYQQSGENSIEEIADYYIDLIMHATLKKHILSSNDENE